MSKLTKLAKRILTGTYTPGVDDKALFDGIAEISNLLVMYKTELALNVKNIAEIKDNKDNAESQALWYMYHGQQMLQAGLGQKLEQVIEDLEKIND